MLFRILPVLFLSLNGFGSICLAQSEPFAGPRSLLKISIISPGLSYEHKIGRLQTLYARAFLDASGYVSASNEFGTRSKLYLDPAFTLQHRYYYNTCLREKRGRRTDMNNLNYFGPVYKVTFNAEQTERSLHTIGGVWGLQRNYQSRFSLDVNVGLGYQFARESREGGQILYNSVSELTLIGQLNLGFWLNRRE